MSMRISVLETVPKKSTSLTHLNSIGFSRPSDFYVRNHQISTKSKSPFRKYEKCIRDSSTQPKPLPLSPQTTVTTSVTVHPSSVNNRYKLVNTFEDLVITCVESGPTVKDKNVVCYKKRYLVNLGGGTNWNICNTNNETDRTAHIRRSPIRSEKSIKFETKIDSATRNTSSRQVELNVKRDNVSVSNKQHQILFRQRSVSSEDTLSNRPVANNENLFESTLTSSNCGRTSCMNSLMQKSSDIKTVQPPLGTSDNQVEVKTVEKKVRFDFDDDSLINIELNPDTAEQFIDLLILEDSLLRKKISEGDVDPKTFRKLERLTELRFKYLKYKEALQARKQQNESLVQVKDILIESCRVSPPTQPPPIAPPLSPCTAPSVSSACASATKSIPVYHTEKLKETRHNNVDIINNSSNSHSCSTSANSSSNSHRSKSTLSPNKPKLSRFQLEMEPVKRISSLRDAAFSHELRFHPLIRENSYLRSKLD